jgi:DNA replication protein DnaC
MNDDTICKKLESLKLNYLAANMDKFITEATKAKMSPQAVIEYMVRLECDESKRRSIESRMRQSKVDSRKWRTMADFDWNWPKKINRRAVEKLFDLTFLEEPANVILMGPSSLGKSMIARNLVHHAVMQGHNALFIDAAAALNELDEIDSARQLRAKMKYYSRPRLLVIDEVGFLSFSTRAGDLLFQLISERYEKSSIVVTTNVNFKEWGKIFPQAACVSAMLERLLHRAEIINIEGESYRMKEAGERNDTSKASKKGQRK